MAENEIKVRLQSAYKTESEWTASNPILKEGEVGYVADSNVPNYGRYKIGDGTTAWKNLPWGDQNIQEKFDDLEIGGRNLLKKYIRAGQLCTKIDDLTVKVGTGVGDTYFWLRSHCALIAGETYTISCEASNVPDGCNWSFGVRVSSSTWQLYINKNGKIFATGVLDANVAADTDFLIDDMYDKPSTAPNIILTNFKLEKGNKATDWTPAPEDKADVSHTHPASDITSGTLSSDRLPTIPVSKGGTGLTSLTSGQALIGNGTGNIATRAIDTTSGGTSGSTSLITSGAVYSGLSGKANSSHTHNYAGSPSAGGAANLLYLPRVSGSSNSANYQPGANRIQAKEFNADCSDTPSAHYYHILTGQGPDSDYNTQLALGMTKTAVYYRKRTSGSWGSWKQIAFIDSDITGNAATATKASQDASGNTITSSYAASLSVSGRTLTLKSKSGATLSTVTTQDTTYSAVTRSSNGLMIASDKVKLDGLIPLTDAEIDEIFNEATSGVEELDSIYPIGSVYISINHTNPGTIFGGTWERFGNGKVLVGVDENDTDFSTAKYSGGEKTHVLTTAEMPSHSHTRGTLSADSVGGHTHSVSATAANNGDHYHHMNQIWSSGAGGSNAYVLSSGRSAGWRNTGNAGTHGHSVSGTAQSNGGHSHTISGASDSTGNGKSHNNLQPYITVYMWLRTA